MTAKALRPHQAEAIAQMRGCVARNNQLSRRSRIMLKLATGAGKTITAAEIVRSARAKGKRVLFIVDALSLIDQTVEAFWSQGVGELGVIQADHPMTDWSKPVQIASVQTLQRRGMPAADIVIVDEAHGQNEWLSEIMQSATWKTVLFIGLSATPWSRGLGHLYDDLITPISMQQLIDLGLLCPFRAFAVAHPDLSGVKTTRGDFHEGQLAEVMAAGNLIADIVSTWQRLGENRPTFAFAVDRAHAKAIQRRFEGAGVPCGYIDAFTKVDERKAIQRQLNSGEIKIVCNVGCLTKGVDWAIGCIILARPTQSEMLYVQMVGRGLRVNDGIPDCIILDHADNTLRMGFVTDVDAQPRELCKLKRGEKAKAQKKVAQPKECPSCHYLKAPKVRECPACGFVAEKQSAIEEADGELVEVSKGKAKASRDEKQSWFSQLHAIKQERGYSDGWVSNIFRKKFGVWPRGLNAWIKADVVTPEVRGFVKSQLIAFAHRRAA